MDLDELQKDLDDWIYKYNTKCPHQGKRCQGKTPMETLFENIPLAKAKNLDIRGKDLTLAA